MVKDRTAIVQKLVQRIKRMDDEEAELAKIILASMQMGYDICKMAGKETTT